MGNWKRFLGDSEKHLNIDLNWMTCWQYLTPWITTVNSQWNGVTKSQKKKWMNVYLNPTDSKHYTSYLSNYPKPCLNNTTFWPAKRICMIIKNKNDTHMKLKELRTILKTQNYLQIIVEKRI